MSEEAFLLNAGRAARYRRAMEGQIIRDESGRLVPMRFSDSQKLLWKFVAPQLDLNEKLWFIVLKSRQVYATTFFENLTFIRTIEQPNTNSLIIAQDLDSAGAIFGMAKRFYDHLPLPKFKPSKAKEIVFELPGGTSNFRVISAGNAAKGRGTTQTCVHCSEVAFWQHGSDIMAGLFQAIPNLPNTLWVLESTANGLAGPGAVFYEQWKAAVSGRSSLIPVFLPWFIMPKYRAEGLILEADWDDEEKLLIETWGDMGLDGHSLAWRRDIIATKLGSTDLFHQEYPSTPQEAFISTGLPAFDPLAILKQAKNIRPPKLRGTMVDNKFVRMPKGEVMVWNEPISNHAYYIGVDTAEGIKGGDYACAQVVDMTDLEQVAVIHGTIQPWDLAHLLAKLGKWYNTAMINIEVKSTGYAVQDYLLRTIFYPRLHPWKGKADHVRTHPSRLYGWDTNVYSRPLLIESGRRAINRGLLTIHDEATLDEIKHFSKQDSGKYEASAGHDDRVLALLLALRSGEENHGALRAAYWMPEMSETDPSGIRIIDVSEPSKMAQNRIRMLLKKKATQATKNWMQM
jgi:hypothetical protein